MRMSKLTKYSLAVVLKNGKDEFLAVKRPEDDIDHAGHWGLPAVSLMPGELPEQAALRTCREKLGCEAKAERFLGIMHQKRNAYDIFLMDVEMTLTGNEQPDIAKAKTEGTAYIDQKWATNPEILLESAKAGSCCSTIFLTDQGLLGRDDWVASLEGSDDVG
jgi:ADP-ribose pyrophosphatase YjhB (NUDIX family)